MTIDQFTELVFNKFNSQITDEIFLFIENDPDLLKEYQSLLQINQSSVLNSNIAKKIKAKYGFDNKSLKNKKPKSSLIKSFEEFEL